MLKSTRVFIAGEKHLVTSTGISGFIFLQKGNLRCQKLARVFPLRFLALLFKGVVPRLSSSYCLISIQSHSMGRPGEGGGGGGLDSPIILTGTFNLVSGHALHSAPWFNVFIRFDKA